MEKPISLKRKDFTNELAKLINKSELPAFMLIDIFKDATSMLIDSQARIEAEAEAAYYKSLETEKKNESD